LEVLLGTLAGTLAVFAAEAVRHRRALKAIPVRVHVNGSRGKSSVTRLVAAALRAGGWPVVAKTTGSQARLILPDGHEEPVRRYGSPNISEQIRILERARREGARAVVMECMAIRPDLQRASEESILRSTIGVITNVRPDHLEVMGPGVEDVAAALGGVIPRGGTLVLGDGRFARFYEGMARRRGTRLVVSSPRGLPPGVMERFSYVEHEENVATALEVARLLGVPDEVALAGMTRVRPDVGASTLYTFSLGEKRVRFLHAFAANDLESTLKLWRRVGFDDPGQGPRVALLNLRGDRVQRSLEFASAVGSLLAADLYLLVGDIPAGVLRRFQEAVPAERLVVLGKAPPEQVFAEVAKLEGPEVRVGGMGNIGGMGHPILRFVQERAQRP
jgi:poly-gamma-glutamate synthase PgsB/CapB